MSRSIFDDPLLKYCQDLEQEYHLISKSRKIKLDQLSHYITKKIQAHQVPKIIVICTHNSRRSHIGQIWLAVASDYYGVRPVQTYSGGTEATAFNVRAVQAFKKIGFHIQTEEHTENPVYQVSWQKNKTTYQAFSKKYNQKPNPTENFAAVMVCSEADQGCPLVSGCDFRLALPFEDPKKFDDTEWETVKYAERIREIGREMFYVIHQTKHIK